MYRELPLLGLSRACFNARIDQHIRVNEVIPLLLQ